MFRAKRILVGILRLCWVIWCRGSNAGLGGDPAPGQPCDLGQSSHPLSALLRSHETV